MSNYTNVYNQLIALAQKRDRDQITAKEWNTMVGTLALQLNTMGANLDVVHEQLENISELDEEAISEIMESLIALEEQIELLESKIGGAGDSHYLGDDLPDPTKYKIWFSPSDLEEDIEEQVFNLMMETEGSELIIDSPKTTEEILLIDKQQEEVLVLDTNAEYTPILVEHIINKEILVMEKQKEVLVIETNDI